MKSSLVTCQSPALLLKTCGPATVWLRVTVWLSSNHSDVRFRLSDVWIPLNHCCTAHTSCPVVVGVFAVLSTWRLFNLSLWCQVGTGAVWPLTKLKRSFRTPQRAPSWSGTALRGITCSPSLPWRRPVPLTCGSSTNTANSSWTLWSWWGQSWSSLTAWSTWWSTTSTCPGPVIRCRSLSRRRRRPTAQCSCCSPNLCTRPRPRCSTCVASLLTGGHGGSRICRCPAGWRTTWRTTPTMCRTQTGAEAVCSPQVTTHLSHHALLRLVPSRWKEHARTSESETSILTRVHLSVSWRKKSQQDVWTRIWVLTAET